MASSSEPLSSSKLSPRKPDDDDIDEDNSSSVSQALLPISRHLSTLLAATMKSHEAERESWKRERELLLNPMRGRPPAVGIFWDYENCSPPLTTKATLLVKYLRNLFQPLGPIHFIRCYQDVGSQPVFAQNLRAGLEACGVEVRDCGRWGRKDVADHHIMTDMLLFALDNPAPATIVLISGDKDFSYLCANLRHRKYEVIIVESPVGAADELKSSASVTYKWRELLRDSGAVPTKNLPPPNTAVSTPPILAEPMSGVFTPRRARSNSDPPERMSPGDSAAMLTKSKGLATVPAKAIAYALRDGISVSSAVTPSKAPYSSANIVARPRSVFAPLISVLQLRAVDPAPLRSFIAPLVQQEDRDAFIKAGVKTWREYVETAVKSGVVDVGAGEKLGQEWIKLVVESDKDKEKKAPATPKRSESFTSAKALPVSRSATDLSTSNVPARLSSLTPAPPSASTTPRKHLVNALLSSESVEPTTLYHPLVDILKTLPHDPPPLRYIVSALLFAKHPMIRESYGWKSYVSPAAQFGVVELGGGPSSREGGAEWVRLTNKEHPPVPADIAGRDPGCPSYAAHTAELFAPMIECLNSLPPPNDPLKIPAASRSRLALMIQKADPEVFERVGVKNHNDYFSLGTRMGVIRCGMGKDSTTSWVALRREYRTNARQERDDEISSAISPFATPLKATTSGPVGTFGKATVPALGSSAPVTRSGSVKPEDELAAIFGRKMDLDGGEGTSRTG